jgi:PadR family transcriptional regulator PadR
MTFQISAGLLETCVLAILKRGDTYGYVITQTLMDEFGISESTLYPVLRRLKANGLCTTYDESHDGRNRRYYKITDQGKKKYQSGLKEWEKYSGNVNKILQGSKK